jgi:hypothetical protein
VAVALAALAFAGCGTSDAKVDDGQGTSGGTPGATPPPPGAAGDAGAPGAEDAGGDGPTTAPGAKRLFLSSPVAGSFGDGDAVCQSIGEKLGGTWRAVLGTTAPLALQSFSGDGPFVSVTGVVIFSSRAALETGPEVTLNLGVDGEVVSDDDVWTGVGSSCDGWTTSSSDSKGKVGEITKNAGDDWLVMKSSSCDSEERLLCAEQ